MIDLPYEITKLIFEFKGFTPISKKELQTAVDLYCDNKKEAIEKYGTIEKWDTSFIVDMSELFYDKRYFNDNINNWNVSNVKNMTNMFCRASNFNQPQQHLSRIIFVL